MATNHTEGRMHAYFACPKCSSVVGTEFTESSERLQCSACGHAVEVPPDAVQGNDLRRCLACPSRDLFIRKDFPQRLGVALVAVGIVGSSIAWYYSNLWWTFGILFATALADVLLYLVVGEALMCYRCGAQYRGATQMESHGKFDLETHEKHRQIAARTPS
ncbi:MAG: hypothetical protein AAF961_06600 [Planctomycetota bacterium]